MISRSFVLVLTVILAIGVGCSSGGGNALSPDLQQTGNPRDASAGGPLLWGLWDITIDPVSATAEVTPLRSVNMTVNVTRFLQPPVAPHSLMSVAIDGILSDFATGYIVVDISFTHPFPGLNQYTGFDVRGVCIGNGNTHGIADSRILYASEGELQLLNADGLTRWFNPSEFRTYDTLFGYTRGKLGSPMDNFTATLNGYKYFCDTLDPEEDVAEFFSDPAQVNPRGYFFPGNTCTREFELQFPMVGGTPVLNFQYAVTASWQVPDPNPPVHVPDDFPPDANCHEAYCASTADVSDMFYIDETNHGGTLGLMVRVFDHQGAVTSAGVADEVAAIHLETPDGPINGDIATFDGALLDSSLVGQDEISATWLLQTTDVSPHDTGDFPVLVVIESADPDSYDPGIPGFVFPPGVLSAYFMASVIVEAGAEELPPVAVAEIVTPEPWCPGDPIEFDASGSYDQDEGGNEIVGWEWDFDGDGIYGDPYDSGTDENPTVTFSESGTYEVDVRVTDDEGQTDTLDEPLSLSVGGATWVDDDAVPPYDGSFEHPWPTIQDGIDNASSDCGDPWVLVKDGTYNETFIMSSNLKVEGYSTTAPLIVGPDADTGNVITFGSSSNSTITHFRMQPRTTGYGIYLGGSTNNVVEDIEFVDNPGGETCRSAVYGSSYGVTNNEVKAVTCDGYHITQGTGPAFIYLRGGGTKVLDCAIMNLEFTNADSGWGPYVMLIVDGDANTLVARNAVGHITVSGPDDVYPRIRTIHIDGCEGSTFRNNLLFDVDNNSNGGWTLGMYLTDARDMTVEHNTISGVAGPAWIYGFQVEDLNTDPSGVTHRDHIVANLSAGTMNWRWAYLGRWASELPVDYSCAYNVGNAFDDLHDVVAGVGMVYSNPMFMDPNNDDYRVQSGSPCSGTAHDSTDMGAYGGTDPLTWLPD
jgi:PKD repeat protein